MDGNNTQNQSSNTVQQAPQGLDQQAVQLAQAIRQTESGGDFTAQGKSGEYGAYQWMPDTWQSQSSAAGVNVPLDQATPEEQNQVAYTTIEGLKNKGYNPGQIASIWNSGSPTAYLDQTPGVNAEGVSYNTPQYAQNVAQTYQSIKNGQPITQPSLNQTTSSGGSKWYIPAALGLTGVALAAAAPFTGGASLAGEPAVEAGLAGEAAMAGAGADAAASGVSGLGSSGILGDIGGAINNAKTALQGTSLGRIALDVAGGVDFGTSIVNEGKNILGLGGNSAQQNADEQASAEEQAGNTQAQATQQAAQTQADEAESIADSQKASQEVASALNQSMQGTQTGRVLSQSPQIQSGIQANANYGFVPDVENGFFNPAGAIKNNQNAVSELSDGVAQILDKEGATGSLSDVQKDAYANIEKYTPIHEQAAAKKSVDSLLGTYNDAVGGGTGTISLGNMERMKKEQYAAAGKWDATKTTAQKQAHKALGIAARKNIYDKTAHKSLYEKAMKQEADLINGQKVLKHLNGKKAPEHKGLVRGLLGHYAKYVGTVIGDKLGGALGAVVGTMIGEHLTHAVDKRFGKTYFESPAGKKMIELVSKKSPAVAKEIKAELTRFGIKAEELKKELQKPERQLPSGKGVIPGATIRLSSPTTIEKPAQKITQYNTKKGRPTAKGTLGEFVRQKEKEKNDSERKGLIQQAKRVGLKVPTEKERAKKKKTVRGLPIIR